MPSGSDQIGNIDVPDIAPVGTFPFTTDYPHVQALQPNVVIHRFRSGNTKIEQRFLLGQGARRWQGSWTDLYQEDLETLKDFFESRRGPYEPFTLNVPTDDGTSTFAVTAMFEDAPLTWQQLYHLISTASVTFVEVADESPAYDLNDTVTRFPSDALEAALEDQVQEMIPLIRIVAKEAGYPEIFLSDRRCIIGGQLYQARLLTWDGIAQTLAGGPGQASAAQSDNAAFSFGNADRVMRDLAADVDLFRATLEFSLYHVGTGIKIDLWKGEVIDFESTSETEFSMAAVDGLYDVTMQYPPDKIAQVCGKNYDDGHGCPFHVTGGGHVSGVLDLVQFPSADASFCDRGYLTPNGCKAHTMKRFFPGVLATPQSVSVKDNTGGFFGFGHPTQTATSIVNDSLQGQPLVEIYTDIPMPVDCLVAAGRDEGDFYEAIGIIGAGPLLSLGNTGTYDNAGNLLFHTLDGQWPYGFPSSGLGLRVALGFDPAPAQDWFSLDQSGNQTGGDPDKVYSGNSTYLDHFSAGVAFLIIRRTDPKGFQLTTLDTHTMKAIIALGLQGWMWSAPGVRVFGLLTNPVWITINVYLKGIGKRFATITEAEATFWVQEAVDAATICDLAVDKLIGAGTETQFKFQGTLRDIKPLKDWISEILNNCLGSWLFSFGKLKIIIREDSAAANSFSAGNIILGSLSTKPVKPGFNRVTVSFANRDYNFTGDTIPIADNDHILYLGRTLDSLMNLAGAAGKSQAGRIGTVRLKEELGGVTPDEWKKAREVAWATTVLALRVEPGSGCSIDDEEMPGGTGIVRVTGWKLNPDYSITLSGRTTTDSMYDIVAGPKAVDVPSNGVPAEFFPEPLQSAWFPNQAAPPAGDALFEETDLTFGLQIAYQPLADRGQKVSAVVVGSLAVNTYLPDTNPPIVRAQAQRTVDGFLKGGVNYWARVYARDAAGLWSPGSNIRAFVLEDVLTDTNRIDIENIDWPAGDWVSCVLCVGDDEKTICAQVEEVASGGILPSSFYFAGPLKQATYNAPSTAHRGVRIKVKRDLHGGTVGAVVTDIDSGTGVVTFGGLAGTSDDWTGRFVYFAANAGSEIAPPVHFLITAYSTTTGQATLSPDPATNGLGVGDLCYIRCVPNIYTGDTIGDTKIVNDIYPTGAVVDGEKGHLVRGTTPGKPHQLRRIVSNTSHVYSVDVPFDYMPTYFTVELANWEFFADTTGVAVPNIGVAGQIAVGIDNLTALPIVVGAFLIDALGNETPEEFAVIREGYVYGAPAVNALVAKGDLYSFHVDDARFPVGSPGQILSADPTADTGLKWIDGGFPKDFSNQDLTGQTFDGADGFSFELASFLNCTLTNCIFTGRFSGAIFKNTTLTGASLTGVFDGCDFANTTLDGCTLSGSFKHCIFSASSAFSTPMTASGCDFTGCNFHVAEFNGDFHDSIFTACYMRDVDFGTGCNMQGTVWNGVPFEDSTFGSTDFSDGGGRPSNFMGCSFRFNEFDNTNMDGSNLSGASFYLCGGGTAPTFNRCNFTGARFNDMTDSSPFEAITFRTADYTIRAWDANKVISFTGAALTATLPDPALSETWECIVLNADPTNTLSLDPLSLNINGVAGPVTIAPGIALRIKCDGTNYFAF